MSTIAEARAFGAAGFRDVLLAVPLAPARAGELASLAGDLSLAVLVDGPAAVDALAAEAARRGVRVGVRIKADCGNRRAGLDPEGPLALDVAGRVARWPSLRLEGVVVHAGHAYRCAGREAIIEVARQERDVAVGLATRLESAGFGRLDVSVGSTPTLSVAGVLPGTTEARPGNYVYFDAFQAGIGACRPRDCAFTVLATVVGRYPARGTVVLDAGSLALSLDPGPRHVVPDCGFGLIHEEDGITPLPLRLLSLTQEHGVASGSGPLPPEGTMVRIVPNHACLSATAFDRVHAARGTRVEATWPSARGW